MQCAQASLSLITLMPRFLCGLSPRHGWCAVVGNFLHWLLALYQVGFQLNSSTFAAQSLEFGIVVVGILAVRHQMYINVRTNLDLKTRIFAALALRLTLDFRTGSWLIFWSIAVQAKPRARLLHVQTSSATLSPAQNRFKGVSDIFSSLSSCVSAPPGHRFLRHPPSSFCIFRLILLLIVIVILIIVI